eukprot:m.221448 g.221448  ORF g.221448 m.221448 type:complete len:326 (-) comp18719_c3_seq2:130-1107(-)
MPCVLQLALAAAVVALLYFARKWLRSQQVQPKLPVLVTGCDTGFGNMVTKQLAAKGIKVLAGCLTSKGVETLNKEDKTGNVVAFQLDVTSDSSVQEAKTVVSHHCPDGLHAVINNAGILRSNILDAAPISELQTTLDINVVGIARVTKTLLPFLRKGKGRIINVASVVGRFAMQGLGYYSASKHAVEGLSDAWRRELAKWDIKVVIIEPGAMKTPLYSTMQETGAFDRMWSSLEPEVQELYGKEYFQAMHKKGLALLDKLGGDPQLVVDTMDRAVHAKYPPHRYLVGTDAKFVFFPLSTLIPSPISDVLFSTVLARESVRPAALR